jgi:prepilin-type N-terminal cleavage/methylation domain-containing protein
MNQSSRTKGFTLVELLVVIGIIVVLSVFVVLTLNPAELLRQARDSTRVSDLAVMKSAFALYLVDVSSPDVDGNNEICSISASSTVVACNSRFANLTAVNAATSTVASSSLNNGSGWIPVDFTGITSGAPIANLPVDPVNSATLYYAYAGSSSTLTYEINAAMESQKYQHNGANDVESTDGGDNADLYEVGTNLRM